MADNTVINVGTGGDTIATDDIGGIKYPRGKITLGADGVDDGDVSSANPLPINVDGNVANDDPDTGNPIKIGGKASAATPPAVANLDRVDAYFDVNGRLVVAIDLELPAGTNNIGDVDIVSLPGTVEGDIGSTATNMAVVAAAVSGAQMQTDVITLPGSVEADVGSIETDAALLATTVSAGKIQVDVVSVTGIDATDDSITAKLATDVLQNDLVAVTPKFAVIDIAATATIVAAVGGKKIRVLGFFYSHGGAGSETVNFNSGAGGSAITGPMEVGVDTPVVLGFNPVGWFETAAGNALEMELLTTNQTSGALLYVEI